MYFSLILAAAALSFIISTKRRLRFEFSDKQSLIIMLIGCVFGFLGAKLLFCIQNPGQDLTLGGLSFFGTVLFAPVGLLAASKITKTKFGSVLDFAGIYVPLVLAFARIGCFATGCCGAAPVVLPDGTCYTPHIQLVESALDLLIFLSLLAWERNGLIRFPGEQYPKFVILYSFVRMITEQYRDTPKECFGMSEGQWFSVICFFASVIVLGLVVKTGLKKQPQDTGTSKKKK